VRTQFDVSGRKAQHAKTLLRQPGVAGRVALKIMKRPVDLHDEPMAQAGKIRDEGSNGELPSEFQGLQAPVAQDAPEGALRYRSGAA